MISNLVQISGHVLCSVCGQSSIYSSSCQFCKIPKIEMSKITFVRNENGEFVKTEAAKSNSFSFWANILKYLFELLSKIAGKGWRT